MSSNSEYFKKSEQAVKRKEELAKEGIESKMFVDPMAGIFPAHSELEEICLVVVEKDQEKLVERAS
jgi:hypothetical protein